MAFIDQSRGWLVGEGSGHGFILQTSDGGKTFKRPAGLRQSIGNCTSVYARAGIGVLVLGVGIVLRSSDMGRTWESAIDLERLGIRRDALVMSSAAFLSDGRGWLVGQGYGGLVLRTNDYGRSWHEEYGNKGSSNFHSIWPTDEKRRCVVGYSSNLFCTTDDGATWTAKDTLPPRTDLQSNYFRNLVLLPSGRGWVLRDGGYIYRTDDGGQTWHEFDPLSLGATEDRHIGAR